MNQQEGLRSFCLPIQAENLAAPAFGGTSYLPIEKRGPEDVFMKAAFFYEERLFPCLYQLAYLF